MGEQHPPQKLAAGADATINYTSAERIVTCHKAYEVLCGMVDGQTGHDWKKHETAGENHHLTETMAKAWTRAMENADGTHGAHWPMEKTEEVRRQRGLAADPLEWWAAMNMIYSDDCVVAVKLGASTVEFYASMAKAFLSDKDAQSDKLTGCSASGPLRQCHSASE